MVRQATQILGRDRVFDRVMVDYVVAQGARVSWTLHRNFVPAGDYTFQLQVSTAGTPTASDWANVGPPRINEYFATDTVRRVYAKERDLAYRVQLLTADDQEYFSEPMQAYGIFDRRDWLLVRDMLRVKRLELQLFTGWGGWLLKRMREGETPDPLDLSVAVTDPLTDEIITTQTVRTHGTEYVGGYFSPVPFYVDLTPESWDPKRGDQQRNTVDPDLIRGVCPNFPRVTRGDVFVHEASDRRYVIEQVKSLLEHRGQPIFLSVGMRQLPASDVLFEYLISETSETSE